MEITSDGLERELIAAELAIADLRLRQTGLIAEADRRQLPMADGCRSLSEWVASRLDVSPETATSLTRVASSLGEGHAIAHEVGESASGASSISFDRLVELSRLASVVPHRAQGDAGPGHMSVHDSLSFDIAGLRRYVASCRRITSGTEQHTYAGRFLAMQPSLDESWYRLWGQLTGSDGKAVEAVLDRRADTFPAYPPSSLGERRADALVSLAQDTITTSAVPAVSIFIDAAGFINGGETGVAVETGPRVGPNTLQELICTGSVEVNTTGGRPLGVGRKSRVIPARLRRAVLHRDGGCVADGCASRYRLEAHHVIPWSQGGVTEAENLATLCWYHHHVVIHGRGYRLDPDTPPRRRRFQPP